MHRIRSLVLSMTVLILAFSLPLPSTSGTVGPGPSSEDLKPVPEDAVPWGGISDRLSPTGPSMEAAVSSLINDVDRGALYDYVEKLQGFGSRLYRAPGMYAATDWLAPLLLGNGNFSVLYHNYTLDRGSLGIYTVSNIIITLPGANLSSDRVFYIFAHDDAVQSNDQAALLTNVPGADDDASGCAAVIESARVLGRHSFQDTIKFAFFNAEEIGLYGSYYWAENVSKSGENVVGFIDYDMIGYSPGTAPYDLDLYYNPASASQAQYLMDLNSRYDIGLSILPYQTTGSIPSDIQSFYDFSFEGVMGIEEIFNPYYHRTTDTIDKMNLTLVERSTKLAVGALAEWARLLYVDVTVGGFNVSEEDAIEGEPVNVSVQVNNTGNLPANGLEVAFYCDGEQFASRTIDVDENSTGASWAEWTAVIGAHNISVRLDPRNSIVESDDSNNEAFRIIGINDLPKAVLTVSKSTVLTKEELLLNASLSSDVVGGIVDYFFDMGDGNTSGWVSDPVFPYRYEQNAIYTVSLRVRDAEGAGSSITNLSIEVLNRPPTADPSPDRMWGISQALIFFTSGASDPDGNVSCRWDFDDGTYSNETDPVHAYLKAGMYDVRLDVVDDDQAVATYWLLIFIEGWPPIAFIKLPTYEGDITTDLLFEANVTDPDGTVESYYWDFGDGNISYEPSVYHRYERPGRYKVMFYITDDDDLRSGYSFYIYIFDRAPVANGTCDTTEVLTGEKIKFDGNASFDLEGSITFIWDFDDGNVSVESIAFHVYMSPGVYRPTLTVIDTAGQKDVIELPRVQVLNRLPEAIAMVVGKLERNSTIYFDASPSFDAEGPLTYTWDLGDGSFAEGILVEHIYNLSGNFTIDLNVTDAHGAFAHYQRTLWIKEPPKESVQPPVDDDDDDDDIGPDDDSEDGGNMDLVYILGLFNVLWLIVVIVLLFIITRTKKGKGSLVMDES